MHGVRHASMDHQLEEQQQTPHSQQVTPALRDKGRRKEGKDKIEGKLHRDGPGSTRHKVVRSGRSTNIGKQHVEDIGSLKLVTPQRYRQIKHHQKERRNAQHTIEHELTVADRPLKGDQHEQEARQGEEQRHSAMPFNNKANQCCLGVWLPAMKEVVVEMKGQHQQGCQEAQMVQARKVTNIGRAHWTAFYRKKMTAAPATERGASAIQTTGGGAQGLVRPPTRNADGQCAVFSTLSPSSSRFSALA